MSTPEKTSEMDVNKMSKTQKLAALLVVLGPDSAASIMKHMDENELEMVSSEMTKIGLVPHDVQEEILLEFTEVAIQASTALRGGPEYTQTVLEKALGMFKASNVLTRVAPVRPPNAAVQQILELEPRHLFNLLKEEQPQTMALILSYLDADKASQVLGCMRIEHRQMVVERLATLDAIPVEAVERIVQVLLTKLGNKQTRAMNQTGGIKYAADLLNALDKNLSKPLLVALEESNPTLGQSIRAKMFTFEDVAALEMASLQKVLREVDMADLAMGLKNASATLQDKLLGCISKRAAETVREEISFLGQLKNRDVEAAQMRIIDVVRRLENQGELDLSEVREKQKNEVLA